MTVVGVLNVAVAMLLFVSLAGCDILPGRARARAQRDTPQAQTAAFHALYVTVVMAASVRRGP